jgi:hypothetical protein
MRNHISCIGSVLVNFNFEGEVGYALAGDNSASLYCDALIEGPIMCDVEL